jgi:hypothetical protein
MVAGKEVPMYKFADPFREYMDQDSAVLRALERTDRGLFDVDDSRDEDVAALYERAEPFRRDGARARSTT